MSRVLDQNEKIKFCMYLLVGGGSLAVYAYKQIKRKTKIRNLAKQMISAASAGNLEIEAVAWPFRHIDTDLQGEKIVFRFVEIQKLIRRGKNTKWETQWSQKTSTPFLIFDSSGYILVEPDSQFSSWDHIPPKEYSPSKLNPKSLDAFNEFYDHSVSGFSIKSKTESGLLSFITESFERFRILERSIPVGSPLLIHGHFNPEDSSRYIHLKEEFSLFKNRATKLLSEKNYRQSMLDKNKDGIVDLKELCHGFQMALKSSVKNDFSTTEIKSVGTNLERLRGTIRGSEDSDLMLTCGLEEQILSEDPLWRSWLLLYAGAGIIALAIFFIIIL